MEVNNKLSPRTSFPVGKRNVLHERGSVCQNSRHKLRIALLTRALGVVVALLLGCGAWLIAPSPLQAADSNFVLPPNFQMQTVTGGLHFPTDMVILPSGDFLVTEKGSGSGTDGVAHLRLVRQGVLIEDPVLSLSVTVIGDSGLYSIVLDPDFETNHHFYLWYSIGEQAPAWSGKSVDRLSRFTYDPLLGKADLLSEVIILDGIAWSQWHNGGGLAFDAQGNLLVSTGDAAKAALGQDMASLNGKLLRIRPNPDGGYTIPTDNPFVGDENVLPEIYASGLRNPFRIAWSPQQQAHYLIDVGAETWEEVNLVSAGANYGWAVREGPCPFQDVTGSCPPADPIYTDPVVAYPHPPGEGAGVTALAFYSGATWPEAYQNKLFFADFNSHSISMVDLDAPETIVPFGDEIGHPVDLEATEDGLYLLAIYDGEIRFIYYTEGGNQWPTAKLSATPTQGAAPLVVNFSGAGSSDPEGEALVYVWDFGDGTSPLQTSEPQVSHTYASDGDYLATLYVLDPQGGKSAVQKVEIEVYSGAMPSIVYEISGDSQRQHYRGGDTVRFRVEREGGTTGLDATTPYRWSIKLHHNQHVHFVITESVGDEVVLEIPDDSHAADVSLWYEAELIMRTAEGQDVRVTKALLPDVVAMDIRSSPPGAQMVWNGAPQDNTRPIDAVVGQRFTIEAPEVLYYGTTKNLFSHWEITSDGGGEPEIITERAFELLVTTEAKHYVAHYEFASDSQAYFLPSVSNIVAASTD